MIELRSSLLMGIHFSAIGKTSVTNILCPLDISLNMCSYINIPKPTYQEKPNDHCNPNKMCLSFLLVPRQPDRGHRKRWQTILFHRLRRRTPQRHSLRQQRLWLQQINAELRQKLRKSCKVYLKGDADTVFPNFCQLKLRKS